MEILSISGTYIKSLRKSHRLTQFQVAKKVGVSRVAFNRWEKIKAKPSYLHCLKIAWIFKVDCLQLLIPLHPKMAKHVKEIRRLARLCE
jgi:DNA-binding XRE family transcriptional regulator